MKWEASFPPDEVSRLKAQARDVNIIENKYKRKIKSVINAEIEKALRSMEIDEMKDPAFSVEDVLIEHYFETSIKAIRHANQSHPKVKMAKPPNAKIPRSLLDLRKLYDLWRTHPSIAAKDAGFQKYTKRAREMAERIKKEYIKRIRSAYKTYSQDFRSGGEESKSDIRNKIVKRIEVTNSRADTIVNTETTQYYNEARKQVYDEVDDVEYYLFLAIRDHRTTKWCKDRHHLVYKKSDHLTEEETPAIHWNCRSEMVPLNKHNPSHVKIIKTHTHRRDKKCEPLPKGWSK